MAEGTSRHPTRTAAYVAALIRNFESGADEIFCRFLDDGAETVITWRDLERSASAFARAYLAAGIAPAGVVLVFLRHVPQLYGSFFGAMLAGCVPSFMPCTSPRQDPAIYWRSHSALLERIRPAAIVADRETLAEMTANGLDLRGIELLAIEEMAPAAPPLEPALPPADAIGLLQHSSGTTGLKKGTALSYAAIVAQAESYAAAIGLDRRDVIVSWLPLYHDMGLIAGLVMPAYHRVPIVHLDAFQWVAQPGRLLEAIGRHGGTLTWLPNFAFEHLSAMAGRHAGSYRLATMRAFINCSEPCKPASFDRFQKAFATSGVAHEMLQCCYAMAETVFAATQTNLNAAPARLRVDRSTLERGHRVAPSEDESRSQEFVEVGSPIAGATITINDEARRKLPAGFVGEIGLSGDFLFSGYNKDPRRTAENLENGVYYSRDLGFIHDDRLYVLGRLDDLIIVNGRNIYAHEVEAIVSAIDGVKPGRVVAVPVFDEKVGTQAVTIIAEKAPLAARPEAMTRQEILSAVHAVTSVIPKAVHLVEEGWLVKTTSGKISREANLAKLKNLILGKKAESDERR